MVSQITDVAFLSLYLTLLLFRVSSQSNYQGFSLLCCSIFKMPALSSASQPNGYKFASQTCPLYKGAFALFISFFVPRSILGLAWSSLTIISHLVRFVKCLFCKLFLNCLWTPLRFFILFRCFLLSVLNGQPIYYITFRSFCQEFYL